MLQSELLRHGELDWLGRNTYFGDQRNYLETDIDDNFLSDDAWSVAGNADTAPHSTDFNPADALREVPADVTQAATWSKANNFRIDMLFNGGGSVAVADGDSIVGAGDGGSGGTGSTGGTGGTVTGAIRCWRPSRQRTRRPESRTPATSAGSATPGITPTSMRAAPRRTTSRPSSTRTPRGAPRPCRAPPAIRPTAASGSPPARTRPRRWAPTTRRSSSPASIPAWPTCCRATPGRSTRRRSTTHTRCAMRRRHAAPRVTTSTRSAISSTRRARGRPRRRHRRVRGVDLVAGHRGGGTVRRPDLGCGLPRRRLHRLPRAVHRPGRTGNNRHDRRVVDARHSGGQHHHGLHQPDGNSTTSTTGGGAIQKTFTDTGAAGTLTTFSGPPTATSKPASEGTAVESPYEQNPMLDAAFAATTGGGIKYFGADASKPYPNAGRRSLRHRRLHRRTGSRRRDVPGRGRHRHPAVPDEHLLQRLDATPRRSTSTRRCTTRRPASPIAGVTTCNPAGTPFTISQIVASVDQGMFAHMMGNDPRPHYFHQTNLMSQTTGGVKGAVTACSTRR